MKSKALDMVLQQSKLSSVLASLILCLVLVMATGIPAAFGQATATVTGTVMDQSQAVVPGATVLLIDEASGDTRRTVSNSEGYFTISAVQAKTYKLRVELSGFQAWERPGIEIHPGDKINISDIVLAAGAQSETVTVTGDVEQVIPVDSGEKSALITSEQIQKISVVGRSAAELIKILPGITPITGLDNRPQSNEAIGINGNGDGGHQSALGGYAANGTRTESMDIVADGSHVSDPGCNCATPVNPNPDMIQEFKVLQSNFSAENAKGPVVLNSVSKTGGKDFHGEGYLYLRDYRLNSNEWQLNRADQERPQNKYRFPGFNIGGPVLIPGTNFNKNRDKLFFFFGFEYYQQTLDTGVLQSWVPNDAMRNGDFSDASYLSKLGTGELKNVPTNQNGITGISNGVIPQNLIDPGGKVLLSLLPPPNVDPANASGYNYVKSLTLDQNMNQELGRVDYNISDNTKLFVRYNRQRETQNFPVGLWWRNPAQVPYPSPVVGKNVSDSVSTSLTQVFSPTMTNEVVFGLTYINFPNEFEDPKKVSKSALGYPYQGILGKGLDQIPSYTNWGGAPTLFNPGGFDPVLFAKKYLISAGDNITKVHGTHTMKFGAFWEIVTNNQPGSDNSNGAIQYATWGGNSSGNALADLLMGRIGGFQDSNKNVLHNIGFRTFDFYAQDSWKASRRLTLEYGARFAHLGAWYDREGIGLAVFDRSRYSNDPAELGNFTGLVWNAKENNVPLSGGTTRPLFVSPRVGFAYNVAGGGNTVLRGGFGTFRYHDPQGPFPGAIDIPAGHRSATVGQASTLAALETFTPSAQKIDITAMDPTDKEQPVTYSWSLTVSQRLPGKMTWESSYVGNRSVHLTNDGHQNINLVPLGAMLSDPGADPNNFRPFQNYGAINLIRHDLYQNYNGLQTLITRQAGRLNFWASYTFSKALGVRGSGQGTAADNFDLRRNNYGTLSYDRTHVFNIAYSYQLPDFAKSFMNNNPVARGILDGWQISGITQFASGAPLQAQGNSSGFNLTGKLPDGTDINNKVIAGTPDTSVQPFLTCDPRQGLGSDQYINPNCFALPSPGRNGDYIFPYLKGPMYQNHDLSLFKNFTFSESKKLQIRFSGYNFLNHPLKSLTNDNLRLDFGSDGRPNNPSFGRITDNKFGRRIMQIAIKFYF